MNTTIYIKKIYNLSRLTLILHYLSLTLQISQNTQLLLAQSHKM